MALFTALLLICSAVPVLAAEPEPGPAEEIVLAPASLEAQAGWLPNATDVEEGLAEVASEEAARERALENPKAAQEREESLDTYSDVDGAEAQDLLQATFDEELAKLNTDPARSLSDAEFVRPVDETTAIVTEEGNGALLEAGIPVKTEDDEGDLSKVDLSLEATAEGFQTANALRCQHRWVCSGSGGDR